VVRESLFDGLDTAGTIPPASTPGDEPRVEPPQATPRPSPAEPFRFQRLQYLGAFEGTYLMFQDGHDLVVIDQHAAHERINYERILAGDSSGESAQRLLVPETIDLPRSQAELLLTRAELLGSLGIELEGFGGGTVAVTTVPPTWPPEQVRELVTDLAQELTAVRPSTAVDELRHRLAALAACHRSVRAHQRLSGDEIQALLAGLDGAELPFTCPHGRPLLVRFTQRDVKRWFERT